MSGGNWWHGPVSRIRRRRASEEPIRILLVEDDIQIGRWLEQSLTEAGFTVDRAADGDMGWYMGDTEVYDAVVLDLGLPKLSGMEILKRWRAAGRNMPVMVLTARQRWTERVEGLNAGADDYMGKPFHAAEVIARLRALIRRASGGGGQILRRGDLALDVASGEARMGEQPVPLTAQELKVLTYLMQRAGRIVPQTEIIDHVYSLDQARDSNTIEVCIGRLRKKLGRDTIRTIRGLGYRID